MDTKAWDSFLRRISTGYKTPVKDGAKPLNEHIFPGHNVEEGKNFVDVYGTESPAIAVIKNNTGSTTGQGVNTPEQGHGSVVLAYKNGTDGLSIVNHESYKHHGTGEWVHNEHWLELSKEHIKHLARHAGLKVED